MRNRFLGTGSSRYRTWICLLGKVSILGELRVIIEPCFEMRLERARTCHGDFVHYKV